MSLAIILTLFVVVISLVTLWIKKKFSYWRDRDFPHVEGKFPFGSMAGVGFSKHFSEVSKEIYEKFKGKTKAVGIFFSVAPTLLLLDLDLIKNVLVKDFNNFADRGIYLNAESDPLSAHLFAMEGQEWKTMRSKLSPTFTSGKMKLMFSIVSDICDGMINHLKNSKNLAEFEMKDILARFTTDVIGNIAFGLDVNSIENPNSEFRKIGAKIFNPPPWFTMKIIFLTAFRDFARKFGFKVVMEDVSEFFLKSIKETVEYRERNNVARNDFLNLLIELKNYGRLKDESGAEVGKITLNELSAQAFIFFLAGFETSSTTMTFALYELALNQEFQNKLREEIKAVLIKHDNQLNYECMNDMKYLQMVLDETLRKYPPVDNLIRITANDYKITDTKFTIEKGILVLVPAHAIHYDPEIYENPSNFEPERFSEENKAKRHPMAHLPFGDGPRNCIGMRFGLMQAKIGIIKLMLNFKFSPCSKTTIPMEFDPKVQLLSPKNNMWLKVEKI